MDQANSRFPQRYTLLAALGGGGGGSVYQVLDRFLGKKLALKSLGPRDGQSGDEDAFIAEFLLAASVSHPGLVKVFDFGYDFDNNPFFTMELAEGEEISAAALLRSEDRFASLLGRICSALRLLHHFGYHHNDLKPSNIRISTDEPAPAVKILDFGLTKEYDASRAGELGGTVGYMAPELFRSGAPSPQSDIYSLGIILYQLAAGRLPFIHRDPLEVISGHVEKEVPRFQPEAPFFNRACMDVLLSMLEKDPDRRPRSMSEVLDLFGTALGLGPQQTSGEHEIVSCFDTAVLQTILRSRQFRDAVDKCKERVRLACTDTYLAGVLFDLLRRNVQTKFINVRLDNDEGSRTSVHAPDTLDLFCIYAARNGTPAVLPDSCVVDVGIYGAVDARFEGAARIEGESVLNAVMDRLISREHGADSPLETITEICTGNTVIARRTLARLGREGALVMRPDGFALQGDLRQKPGSCVDDDCILAQAGFLQPDEMNFLGALSVFDHDFTFAMASVVIRLPSSEVRGLLDRFTDMRIIRMDGNTYRFRHEPFREALYARLEPSRREEYHAAAARYLVENELCASITGTGMLSRHYLLGGNIEEGVWKAVEYQKLQAERGEFSKPEELLVLCSSVLESSGIKNEQIESELLMAFGDIYRLQGKFDIALEKYTGITELRSTEPRLLAETYKDLGDIYKSQLKYAEGIEALNHALGIYQQLGDRLEISHTLNNMGNMHWINSDYDLALGSYRDALDIQEKLGVIKDVASTLSNMGVAYFVTGSHDDAIASFERSIELKKQIDDKPELARTYNNLAAAYQQMGQFGRALNHLNLSMAINREIGAQKELMINLENVAEVCMGLGKYGRAEELCAEGLELAGRHDDLPHQGLFSCMLAQLHAERGLYGKSMEFLDRSVSVAERMTDKSFAAKTLLLRAANYVSLNAADAAREALDMARRLVSPIEHSSLLIRMRLLETALDFIRGENAEALTAKLDEIDKQAKRNRFMTELCESLLLRLEILARHGQVSTDALERFDELTGGDRHTVLRSFLHLHLGIAAARDRAYREAISHFDRAEVMAGSFEQRELSWRVSFYMGKVRMTQLEYEEAFLKLKQAGTALRVIASNIGDKDMVQRYMSAPEKLELVDTVRQLTVKLA